MESIIYFYLNDSVYFLGFLLGPFSPESGGRLSPPPSLGAGLGAGDFCAGFSPVGLSTGAF